jgi:REP element-mobilizing transposase RayT
MPRVPRIQLEGASYLVHAQGAPGTTLFTSLADYEAYLQLVAQYKSRYGFHLFAYCLMPTEAWLYLEPLQGTTVSAIMHDVTVGYTRYMKKRYGHAGHLFQDRFKEVVVDTQEAMVSVTAYLHLLPVRKQLASKAEAYPFSSYPLYRLGDTVPDLLGMGQDIQRVLQALPGEATPDTYAGFLEQMTDAQIAEFERQMARHVIGSETFVDMVRRRLSRPAHASPASVRTLPEAPAAARAASLPTVPLRIRPAVTFGTAAVMVFAGLVVSLSHRIDGLKYMLLSLAQENEARFRSQPAVAVHKGLVTGLATLEGTTWDVRLAPLTGGMGDAVQQDQLVFSNRRVASTVSRAQGMADAPYRLATLPDGTIGWEAIQADATGQLMTWQGQWHETTMRGTLTQQLPGQSARQFTFVGVAHGNGAQEPRSEI